MFPTIFLFFPALAFRPIGREVEWLAGISKEDSGSLEQLYDAYHRYAYRLLFAILKQQEEVEDVMQDVFAHIWKNASKYDASKGSAYAWILTVIRNKGLDRLRSKAMRNQSITSHDHSDRGYDWLPATEPIADDELELNDRARRVHQALSNISRIQRQTLHLAYFEGLSQSEISERLNMPLGTVKTHIRTGMLAMRDALASTEGKDVRQ